MIARALIAGALMVAVAAAGFLAGAAVVDEDAPGEASSEAGFARDMQTHHAQAVEMSMILRDRTDDDAVRLLAYDIALTQQQQIGQMAGWLAQWGLSQTGSAPPMDWMSSTDAMSGHEMPEAESQSTMPGMASSADLEELRAANGLDAETLYLRLMIAHHRGGIAMAQAVLDASTDSVVTTLAGTIVASQEADIEAMTDMLTERGATP